jgi:hypothetical protein
MPVPWKNWLRTCAIYFGVHNFVGAIAFVFLLHRFVLWYPRHAWEALMALLWVEAGAAVAVVLASVSALGWFTPAIASRHREKNRNRMVWNSAGPRPGVWEWAYSKMPPGSLPIVWEMSSTPDKFDYSQPRLQRPSCSNVQCCFYPLDREAAIGSGAPGYVCPKCHRSYASADPDKVTLEAASALTRKAVALIGETDATPRLPAHIH